VEASIPFPGVSQWVTVHGGGETLQEKSWSTLRWQKHGASKQGQEPRTEGMAKIREASLLDKILRCEMLKG
jgi:hypothetical protein